MPNFRNEHINMVYNNLCQIEKKRKKNEKKRKTNMTEREKESERYLPMDDLLTIDSFKSYLMILLLLLLRLALLTYLPGARSPIT